MGGGAEDRGLSVSGQEEAQPSPGERGEGEGGKLLCVCCPNATFLYLTSEMRTPHYSGHSGLIVSDTRAHIQSFFSHPPLSEERNHGCCWKAFHTDPQGAWYKPHKAGLITGFILVIGWILFIVFFGWIVALALILVFILIIFAYILNFICTGRCKIEEDEN